MTTVVAELRRAVVVLIVINALIGIIAILGGAGDLEWQVIGTTMLITAATLVTAIGAAAYSHRVSQVLIDAAVLPSWLAIVAMIQWIWSETAPSDWVQDVVFVALTVGLASAFALLVLQAVIEQPFEPARTVALGADVCMALLAIVAVLWDQASVELFAVTAIVGAAASLIVVIGSRNIKTDGSGRLARFCPSCGVKLGEFPGECRACGAKFTVTFPG